MDVAKIDAILSKFPETGGNLIAILHEMQNEYHYLPEEELRYISKKTGVPLTQIYSIVNFYNRFSLQPKGKYEINICMGTACHVKGAETILDQIKRTLNIKEGETSEDMKFSLEVVRCIGACGLAPAVVIGEDTYGNMTPMKMTRILGKCE